MGSLVKVMDSLWLSLSQAILDAELVPGLLWSLNSLIRRGSGLAALEGERLTKALYWGWVVQVIYPWTLEAQALEI